MGSNPIGNAPRDPYEAYRVEEIERDRKSKEQKKNRPPPEEPPQEKRWVVFAYVLMLMHKIIELFQGIPEKGISTQEEGGIRENLLLFKAALEMMKKEDRSQDIEFLNRLSQLWQHVLEDALHFKRISLLSKELKNLIDKIQHYPQRQEHSLGYYLAEYAGQKWLPFPFMELIQKIHAEHIQSPRQSALSEWTSQIDEILPLMKSNKDSQEKI